MSTGFKIRPIAGYNWAAQTTFFASGWPGSEAVNYAYTDQSSRWIAVGASGSVATSTDGATWTYQAGLRTTSWGTTSISSVVWNGSQYIIVGNSGKVATSSDGVTWTYQGGLASTTWSTTNCNQIVWNGTKYVVVGDSGSVATSTDGVTWTYQGGLASTTWSTKKCYDIVWNSTSSLFVVCGAAGVIATSSDAVTWTYQGGLISTGYTSDVSRIIWTGGIYLILGSGNPQYYQSYTAISTDAITWTNNATISTGGGFGLAPALSWNGSQFLYYATGGNYVTIQKSTDGYTWTSTYGGSNLPYQSGKFLLWTGSKYILFGSSSVAASVNSAGTTLTITDELGSTGWSSSVIYASTYGNLIFLVAGVGGKVATSADGITWTYRGGLRNTTWSSSNDVYAAIWTGSQFVVGGTNGAIATSPDGITWTYQGGLASTTWGTRTVKSIAYTGNQYVVVGDSGGVATSPDGVTWTYRSQLSSTSWGSTNVNCINWNGTQFIIGPYWYFGSVATSPDGITWTVRSGLGLTSYGSSREVRKIAWTGNQYILVGGFNNGDGAVATSPDGITWTYQAGFSNFLPAGSNPEAWDIVWNGKIAIVASAGYYGGYISYSQDGITWTNQNISSTAYGLNNLTWNGGYSYLATGSVVILGIDGYTIDVDEVLMRREYFNGGNVYGWGRRDAGEMGLAVTSPLTPNIVAGGFLNWKQISTGSYSSAGIKTDGTLWYWGSGSNTLIQEPTSGTSWMFVDCSGDTYAGIPSIAAIKSDSTLWVWGKNANARLGTNNTSTYSSPVTITGGGSWKFVKFGSSWTMGIKTDGTLWGWGYNGEGQLGDGTSINKSSPVQVSGGGTWKTVGAGTSHSSGIKTDGTIWSWGFNNMGQIGNGTVDAGRYLSPVSNAAVSTKSWKQVVCGYRAALAVGSDGTLWGCGYNNTGQLGQGGDWRNATLKQITGGGTNWKQVAFGAGFAMGLKTDGTVWAWGSNNVGQLGQGNTTNTTSPVQVTLPTTSIKSLMSSDPGNQSSMVVADLTI